MFAKKLRVVLIFICTTLCCVACYTVQIRDAKIAYVTQLQRRTHSLLQQQQAMLQGLGKQLQPLIQAQDWPGMRQILQLYEDQIFVLAKQGVSLAAKMQWLSLDAANKIISSKGINHSGLLAQEPYYLKSIAKPQQLILSNIYTTLEMPEHHLINLGLGLLCKDEYCGHLEAQVSLPAIEAYLRPNSNLFKYKIATSLQNPQISINARAYWLGLTRYVIWGWMLVGVIMFVYTRIAHLHKNHKQTSLDLQTAKQQLEQAHNTAQIYKNILHTQYAYGAQNCDASEIINAAQLLSDVVMVNADLVKAREIQVKIASLPKHLRLYANKLSCMRILSGILYEILRQLPNGSRVDIQIQNRMQNETQCITFLFSDNGFYATLEEREEAPNTADVRARGWSNIQRLITNLQGAFTYQHVAYQGNTISFSILRNASKNVVNLSLQ